LSTRAEKRAEALGLIHLAPHENEAIRLYTDALMPTFGNKSASVAAAGMAPASATQFFNRADIAAEVERIQIQRAREGEKVAEFLGDYAMDAAREMVNQLSFGRELTIIDPRSVLGAEILSSFEFQVDENNEKAPPKLVLKQGVPVPHEYLMEQVKHINNHNRVAVAAMKERRAAAETIIAYKIGTPEQRVRHIQDPESAGPIDLGKLTPEQLQTLGNVVNDLLVEKRAQKETAAPMSGTAVVVSEG